MNAVTEPNANIVAAPPVTFSGDRLRVHFDTFTLPTYHLFLRCKALPESEITFHPRTESYTLTAPARFAELLGVTRPAARDSHPLASWLFEDQRILTAQAIDAKRFAVWSGCGNGKTGIGAEFARQVAKRTGGRVLIVTMNDIVRQWISEVEKFYGGPEGSFTLHRIRSRDEMRHWCEHGSTASPHNVAITNYEKFNPDPGDNGQTVNECRHLDGVVLDESSRLKGGGGKQKWALIKSMKGVEYKLSLTATPAPNDTMEFASQASFLEKMRSEHDIIWTFFTRDPKTHRWTVKPHARAAFFEFMSSWSIYVNDPKRYGWRLDQPDVPKPDYKVIDVPATDEQRELARVATANVDTGQLSICPADETNTIQRMKLGQIAKGFRYVKGGGKHGSDSGAAAGRGVDRIASNKPAVVADIIRKEVKGGAQVLVWTVFDEESRILGEQLASGRGGRGRGLPGVEILTGAVKAKDRAAMLDRFREGRTRVLISRARMLGYGQNFQFVSAMVFSGWTDSFEDLYQAVRRAVRFGQTERVRVYFPMVRELEGDTFDNIQRKEAEFERSIAEQEENYIRARAKFHSQASGRAA